MFSLKRIAGAHARGGWGGGPFRGVNFGFWSLLGCSRQKAIVYLAVKVSFRIALEKM